MSDLYSEYDDIKYFWSKTKAYIQDALEYAIVAKLVTQPKLPVQSVVDDLIAQTEKAFSAHQADPKASQAKKFQLFFWSRTPSPLTVHVVRTWFAVFHLVRYNPERKQKRLVHFIRKLKEVSLPWPDAIQAQYSRHASDQVLWSSLPLLREIVSSESSSYRVTYEQANLPSSKQAQLEHLISFWAKLTALAAPRPHPAQDHEVPDDLAEFGLNSYISDTVRNLLDPHIARPLSDCGLKKHKYLDECDCDFLTWREDCIYGKLSEGLIRGACLWISHCADRFWEIAVACTNKYAQDGRDPASFDLPHVTVHNWDKWRAALRKVFDAARHGHVGDFVLGRKKLAEDTVDLLRETITEMDHAKSQGPQLLDIDWKANVKTEDEIEGDAKAAKKTAHWDEENEPYYVNENGDRLYQAHKSEFLFLNPEYEEF